MTDLRPCNSPYCECEPGKCTHPGCYDARGEQAPAAPIPVAASTTWMAVATDPHVEAALGEQVISPAIPDGVGAGCLAPTDAEMLDWIENCHTLHRKAAFLYVVDGYQVEITSDEEPIAGPWHGETLRDAIAAAMKDWTRESSNGWHGRGY